MPSVRLFFVLLLCYPFSGQSQTFEVNPIYLSGKVLISSGGTYASLKKTSDIPGGQRILVSDQSFALLMSNRNTYMELSKPGIYFTDSILGVLSKTAPEDFLERYKKKLTIPDSLTKSKQARCVRLLGRVMRCPQYMSFIGPEYRCHIYDSTIFIHWYNRVKNIEPPYIIQIHNIFQDHLFSIQCENNWAWVSLPFSEQDKQLAISVFSMKNPHEQCDPIMVEIADESISLPVDDKLYSLQKTGSGFQKILQALIFEEHKLYLDAMRCYDDAIRRAPYSQEYKALYVMFLVRNKYASFDQNQCDDFLTAED